MNILVTGCAGFIGYHLAQNLLKNSTNKVIGIDSINDYYDPKIKKARLKLLKKNKFNNFRFIKNNLKNIGLLNKVFRLHKIEVVIHLAAQAGVRYSFVTWIIL